MSTYALYDARRFSGNRLYKALQRVVPAADSHLYFTLDTDSDPKVRFFLGQGSVKVAKCVRIAVNGHLDVVLGEQYTSLTFISTEMFNGIGASMEDQKIHVDEFAQKVLEALEQILSES